MDNLSRDIRNGDGTVDTVIISSNDNYSINLDRKYKLANRISNKNSFSGNFKNSIFGADIGYKSYGFISVAVLSTLVAVTLSLTLFLLWRL